MKVLIVKIELLLRTAVESARIIAAKMIGISPSDVKDADILSSVAEIVNIIAGRLRNRLIETSSHAQIGLPSVWVGTSPAQTPVPDTPEAIVLYFRAPQHQFSLELTLAGSAIGAGRSVGPN